MTTRTLRTSHHHTHDPLRRGPRPYRRLNTTGFSAPKRRHRHPRTRGVMNLTSQALNLDAVRGWPAADSNTAALDLNTSAPTLLTAGAALLSPSSPGVAHPLRQGFGTGGPYATCPMGSSWMPPHPKRKGRTVRMATDSVSPPVPFVPVAGETRSFRTRRRRAFRA